MTDETVFIAHLIDVQTREKAFRELISLYKERLYWHIRKIVISHDDTDDVLQNTFIKVYKNIDKFKSNIRELKNFNKKINIYDFTSFFCNSNVCTNYVDKIDLYIFVDNFSHLTKEFSNYISSDFDTFLKSMKN